MLKCLRTIFAMLLAVSLGSAILTGQALAAGAAITGTIANGTSGGPVSQLNVTLTTFINAAPSGTLETVTDGQGNYQFNGLSTGANYAYGVDVVYDSVQYSSDFVQLTVENPVQTVNITVYETTATGAAVQISGGHVIIVPTGQGVLSVLEVWGFTNTGDRTYIGEGDGHVTARFTLPEGASNFSAGVGISVDSATGIVTDTIPIIPGTGSAVFTYNLSYQGSEAVITMKLDYPTSTFNLLVPQQGIVAESTTLTQAGPQDFQGMTYLNFTGTDLSAGQVVDIKLAISPEAFATAPANTPSPGGIPWSWILVVILALALGFVILYPRLTHRKVTALAGGGGLRGRDDIEETLLLERLARLDDKFDAGEIAETEYKERRDKTKARLIAIRARRKL